MFGDFVKYVAGEWEMISQAPVSFGAAVIVCTLLVWLFRRSFYTGQITTLNERIKLRDDQINDIQRQLKADTPADALVKLGELTARVEALSIGVWEPLSKEQLGQLEARLKTIRPGSIYITIVDDGRVPGRLLEQLFLKLGWRVTVHRGIGGRSGIWMLSRSSTALAIAQALASVGFKVNINDKAELSDDVKIAIGDKPVGVLIDD